jgi:hypothetical protein
MLGNIQAFPFRLLEKVPLEFGMSVTDYELDLQLLLFESQHDFNQIF